jgi:hypothetical protein
MLNQESIAYKLMEKTLFFADKSFGDENLLHGAKILGESAKEHFSKKEYDVISRVLTAIYKMASGEKSWEPLLYWTVFIRDLYRKVKVFLKLILMFSAIKCS